MGILVAMNAIQLSDNEKTALALLYRSGGLLVTAIESKTETDFLGRVIPGRGVFNRIIKKGLAYQTEEPVLEDGFQFTETIELSDEGEVLARKFSQEGY